MKRPPLAIRFAEKLQQMPESPGVYLMKNAQGEVFYVGKAKSLKDRIRSYLTGADTRRFVATLDVWLADLEVVLTDSEKEALLLENELIKAHRPRFNVKLTDDKRFLCLKLDTRQAYPRLQVVRRFSRDGARYFGPYASASNIREALKLINRHFQLRTCTDQAMRNRSRPCLQHQIKRCPAPCVFDLSQGQYTANVENVIDFLEGRQTELVDKLKARMQSHSDACNFEAAAALRDQIKAVERSLERQRMVSSDFVNRDIVGLYREGPALEISVMRVRNGRLQDAKRVSIKDSELDTSEVLADFAVQYYTNKGDVPDEILMGEQMQWAEPLAQLLSEQKKRNVRIVIPKRGDKKRLIDLADKNAHQAFADKQREAGAAKTAIEGLKRVLHLTKLPNTIECMDISHIMGEQIVASVVQFVAGAPNKAGYRHYKIKTTTTQDDFKSMYEVVSRRAHKGLKNNDLPDLMVIDGGKGQLGAARAALNDVGVIDVDLISLAKARQTPGVHAAQESLDVSIVPPGGPNVILNDANIDDDAHTMDAHKTPSKSFDLRADVGNANEQELLAFAGTPKGPMKRFERIFVSGHKNPVVLRQNSAELFMLVRARDEAHRFAITFHRKLRQKAATRSILDDIPGLGPKRRKQLLQALGSVTQIKQASIEALQDVVGPKLAQAVHDAVRARQSNKN